MSLNLRSFLAIIGWACILTVVITALVGTRLLIHPMYTVHYLFYKLFRSFQCHHVFLNFWFLFLWFSLYDLPPPSLILGISANMNGHYVEAGNIGVQGYQMTATNIGSSGFLHSSMAQGATPIFIILLHLCKGSEVIIITFCPKWLHRHVEHQQSVLHIPASMHSRTLQMLGLHL